MLTEYYSKHNVHVDKTENSEAEEVTTTPGWLNDVIDSDKYTFFPNRDPSEFVVEVPLEAPDFRLSKSIAETKIEWSMRLPFMTQDCRKQLKL